VAQVTGLPGPIKPVKAPRLPRDSAPEDGSERPAEPSPTDSPAYLRDLNVAQRAAVEHGVSAGGALIPGPGPLLIIAGAGTGKTSTLAHRVAHLILTGTLPERILLLTFTRRAAAEMTNRAQRILGTASTRRR
jgi:DNA helicase II / ATP-dependent DNA helicase PcrA